MLPLMTPRYYSISSSPLAAPGRCSVTVAVVSEPAWSGNGTFEGVASTYLRRHDGGETIDAFVKDSKSGFRVTGRRVAADRHDRAGDGARAVPRVSAGARGAARALLQK